MDLGALGAAMVQESRTIPLAASTHVALAVPSGWRTEQETSVRRPQDAPKEFQLAWNAHDMAALGALFEPDATFVNRFGHYVAGVSEIVALHAPIHRTIYSDSTLDNELIDCELVGEAVAIEHFWSRLSAGAAHPVGPHTVDTLMLAVLTRRDGEWLIKALENVTLTNPRTGEAVLRPSR
jgi:uncharacterized protein (TIGR02246 family)